MSVNTKLGWVFWMLSTSFLLTGIWYQNTLNMVCSGTLFVFATTLLWTGAKLDD